MKFSLMCFTRILFIILMLSSYSIVHAKKNNSINYSVIPLTFDDNLPIIKIHIQNKTIPLLLDLGTAKLDLTLSPSLIKKFHLKVKYTGITKKISDTQGRKAIIRQFILPEITIGHLTIRNIKGFETHPFPWGTPGKAPEIIKNGVVGLGLLSRFNIIIDYKRNKLFLIKGQEIPQYYKNKPRAHIPFIFDGNVITPLTNGSSKIKLLWDTGAPINLIKPDLKLSGEIIKCDDKAIRQLGLNQNKCKGIKLKFNHDNPYFQNINFYIYPMQGLPADGVIGEPFFRNHPIYINFLKKEIVIF